MTSLDNDITTSSNLSESAIKNEKPELEDPTSNHSSNSHQSTTSVEQQFCQTCQTEFGDRTELLKHLLVHVKLPSVVLQRCDDPEIKKKALTHKCGPLRFSIKTTNNNFHIVKSPENLNDCDSADRPPIPKLRILLPEQVSESLEKKSDYILENRLKLKTSGITITEITDVPVVNGASKKETKMVELHTLPNESQSPSFPTQSPAQPEVNSDENNSFWGTEQPAEDPLRLASESGEKEAETHNNLLQNFLNDTVETIPKDAGLNSNENEYISLERLAEKNGPKCPVCDALCLDKQSLEVHQKAMGHYLPTIDTSSSNSVVPYRQNSLSSLGSNPLDSLANLPMQQLAQQVNRLQQGPVHQQNVLINIQQFGQPMGHPQYGRPPEMPPHYPSQHYPPPPQPQAHMYGGYHHTPHPDYNHPMYYPQSSGIYPSMQMPSQMSSQITSQMPSQLSSQMPAQMSAQMPHQNNRSGPHPYHNQPHHNAPRHNSPQSHQTNMMPPRAPPPQQQPRMAPPPNPGQQQMRPRARMPMQQRPGAPRMSGSRPQNAPGPRPNMPQQVRPARRIVPAPNPSEPAVKRKRMDVLIPDTNDNDDCHVISMQKCNDGMPIIKNVQGAPNPQSNTSNTHANTPNNEIDPIVHLTDSITLSVRNPKEPPTVAVQQKKNDAKAVANILATRGITVTPAAKTQKEQGEATPPKRPTPPPAPVAINLNNAVSIIPTARQQQHHPQHQHQQQQQQQQQQHQHQHQQQHQQQNGQSHKSNNQVARTPTVDLTDDEPIQAQQNSPSKSAASVSKRTLPHQCDLCPAQYPTLQSLMNHRRTYHKTGTPSELGVPVVDLRQAQVLSKLAAIGIHNYIPLPQLGNGAGNFALPIVSVNASKNPNICNLGALGSGAVLPLGPLRHISNLPNGK